MSIAPRRVAPLVLALVVAGCGDDPCTTCVEDGIRGTARYFDGTPIEGAEVRVFGKPAVVTDESGSFAVAGVEPPYDIALVLPTAPIQVWRGLTRADPTLFTITGPPRQVFAARVSGRVPVASDKHTLVFFVAAGVRCWTTANPWSGAYQLDIEWTADVASDTGHLYVLRSGVPTGQPNYDGWSTRQLSVTAGDDLTQDFAASDLDDPADATITGHLDLPEGFVLDDLRVNMELDDQRILMVNAPAAVDGNGNFELLVPNLPSVTFEVVVRSEAFEGSSHGFSQVVRSGLQPGTQSLVIRADSPPSLAAPAPEATDVDINATFSWMPGSGEGIYLCTIWPEQPMERPLYVLQSAAVLRLEAIPAAVFRPTADADHRWWVRQLLPLPDTDTAAAPGITSVLFQLWDDTASEVRTFRTAL